jgi:hypothetical protein
MFIVGLRFYFNTVNSYLNALWISELQYYCVNYITNPAFFTGTSFFLIGVCHNVQSDSILLSLRKQGATDYKISQGDAYQGISFSNALRAGLEWIGRGLTS